MFTEIGGISMHLPHNAVLHEDVRLPHNAVLHEDVRLPHNAILHEDVHSCLPGSDAARNLNVSSTQCGPS